MILDSGESRQRFRAESDARCVKCHAATSMKLSSLEPASAPVPAASEKEHNENDDDEKCGVIHVGLLRFESRTGVRVEGTA